MGRFLDAGAALLVMTLAGCAGGPSMFGGETSSTPEVAMSGRWMLSAPNAPACGMNFAGSSGKQEGRVAPEGGCPERFFTSRRWILRQGTLTINDDENNPLATLSFADGRFQGKSTADTPVTLTR